MSSEVQIAVIDQQDTQIVLAVPGVQGATGSPISAGGTANQVLRKASSTNYDTDWSLVTNAMVDSSAAIAGTKISPNFGSQNVVTTGTSTAASFIPTSSSVPTNGVYLPSANNVAISTNGTGRLFVDSSGRLGIGTATPGATLDICPVSDRGVRFSGTLASHSQIVGTQGTTSGNLRPLIIAGSELSFATGSAVGTSFTQYLKIDGTGRVGIGTTSPSELLHVAGGNARIGNSSGGSQAVIYNGANAELLLWEGNGVSGNADTTRLGVGRNNTSLICPNNSGTPRTAFAVGTVAAEPLVFSTNNTERARIDSSGRLGLGTSSPSSLLHLNAASGSVQTQYNNGGTSTYIGIDSGFTGCDIAAGGGIRFRYFSGGSYQNGMVLDTSGRLGIGTTSPSVPLQVLNAGTGNNTNNGAITLCRTGTVGSTLYHMYSTAVSDEAFAFSVHGGTTFSDTTYTKYLASAGGVHIWYGATNATERARITSSGQLLVGTSTAISPPFLSGNQTGLGSILTNGYDNGRITIVSNSSSGNNVRPASLALVRTGSDANTTTDIVVENYLGSIDFIGRAGGAYNLGATIYAAADGGNARGLGSGDMPSRIVFAVSNDASATPTERYRIMPDGQWCFSQSAPPTRSTTATLSVGDIRSGLILSDPASGITFTLVSGSDIEGQYGGIYTGMAFEWSIVNINVTNAITIANGTGHTYTGNTTIAANTSARFLTRRSASQTFVTYRIA